MFRDYSKIDDLLDPSHLECGALAMMFPKDVFYEVSKTNGRSYNVSLDNVADQNYLKLFQLKPEFLELQNPLFINWMVDS